MVFAARPGPVLGQQTALGPLAERPWVTLGGSSWAHDNFRRPLFLLRISQYSKIGLFLQLFAGMVGGGG